MWQNPFCFLVVFCFFFKLEAQNLVINPSFEDTIKCPQSLGQVDRCIGWKSALNTPDFFSCNNSEAGMPLNYWGYQNSNSGNAYAGIIVYSSLAKDQREMLISKLNTSLIKGKKYYVSFKYNRANNTKYATNKIGFTFSTVNITQTHNINKIIYKNRSLVYSNKINSDTTNWNSISGSFTADSSYEYVLIGNFFSDSLIDIDEDNSNFSDWSYYYIDDVCVSEDSTLCFSNLNDIEKNIVDKLVISPNPTSGLINISLSELFFLVRNDINISVLSFEGKLQIEKHFPKLEYENIELDLSNLSSGIYQVLVSTPEISYSYKLFKL